MHSLVCFLYVSPQGQVSFESDREGVGWAGVPS